MGFNVLVNGKFRWGVVDKEHKTHRQKTDTVLLTLPLLIKGALDTPLNTVEPLFPHLWKGNNDNKSHHAMSW